MLLTETSDRSPASWPVRSLRSLHSDKSETSDRRNAGLPKRRTGLARCNAPGGTL